MTKTLTYLAIIFCALFSSQAAFADVKIKSKQTMSGQSYENTTYIKGKRQRTETMNGMTISITQCDLRRGLQINPNSKTYMVNPFATATTETTTTKPATVDKNGVVQAGGTITTTVTTKDTGERKQMFGYTARRLIVTMEMNSSPDACNKTKMKMETDGWYIDFEPQFDCGDTAGYANYKNYKASGCQDRSVMKTVGTAKRGYPVYEKMTMFDENGKESMSYINEVIELSKATLDASLFDLPQGYTEVSDASQMYASMSAASSMATTSDDDAPAKPSSIVGNASNASATASTATGPKQAGTIRIGLAGVKTGAIGEGLTAGDLAMAVQNTLVNYLKVPNVEVVTLEAKLASAIDGEAKQKECDFVIHATVSHKKGGGGFGMFKAIAPVLSSVAPMAGAGGSVAGHVAGTVASQAIITAANVSGNIKSKDEITLDIKLNKIDGTSALAKAYKVKAKSNGEDIISAAVEQAAQSVVDSISK